MSGISLYEVSIGYEIQGIKSLLQILRKAAQHPEAATFPMARLHPDMRPLIFQVHTCSDICKKTAKELGRIDPGVWPNDEQTMDELIARAEKTLRLLESVDPKVLEGREDEMLVLQLVAGGTTHEMTAKQLVFGPMLPNFFFHLTTAYDILRKEGVPFVKFDYLTPFLTFMRH